MIKVLWGLKINQNTSRNYRRSKSYNVANFKCFRYVCLMWIVNLKAKWRWYQFFFVQNFQYNSLYEVWNFWVHWGTFIPFKVRCKGKKSTKYDLRMFQRGINLIQIRFLHISENVPNGNKYFSAIHSHFLLKFFHSSFPPVKFLNS